MKVFYPVTGDYFDVESIPCWIAMDSDGAIFDFEIDELFPVKPPVFIDLEWEGLDRNLLKNEIPPGERPYLIAGESLRYISKDGVLYKFKSVLEIDSEGEVK